MVFKTKKTKKSKGQRGNTTHGRGARKKGMGSGQRGGVGMAGTGKRAGQKKTLILKLYGNDYFGRRGITSRPTKKRINKVMNLGSIEKNFDKLKNKKNEIELKDYKILGDGEIKTKMIIIARAFSESARKKIEKAGGSAIEDNKEKEDLKIKKAKKE